MFLFDFEYTLLIYLSDQDSTFDSLWPYSSGNYKNKDADYPTEIS